MGKLGWQHRIAFNYLMIDSHLTRDASADIRSFNQNSFAARTSRNSKQATSLERPPSTASINKTATAPSSTHDTHSPSTHQTQHKSAQTRSS